jgi:hypothetical protein
MYKKVINLLLCCVLLSNLGITEYWERPISNYYLSSLKHFLFSVTKLNWDYGFFSSSQFGYISSEIELRNTADSTKKLSLTHKDLVSKYNYIRAASLLPSCMTDSMNIETSSRSIALFLFNKYEGFNYVTIRIYNNNYSVSRAASHFALNVHKQKIYDQSLYY